MANEFYVQPAGDFSQGLQGLGIALKYAGDARMEREETERKRVAEQEAQAALYDAVTSDDPMKMAEAAAKHPSIAKQMAEIYGVTEGFKKQEAVDFLSDILANPNQALEKAQRRAALLPPQNRDPAHTLRFIENYQRDPAAALHGAEMIFAGLDNDAWGAYKDNQTKAVTDLGKLQQDLNAGLITQAQYDEAAAGLAEGGGEEYGLQPMWAVDAEGNYTPYFPNKAGGVMAAPQMDGQRWLPDAARMGFNPNNIAERAGAEAQAKLDTAPVTGEAARVQGLAETSGQRSAALASKEAEFKMLDDVVQKVEGQANKWTTGFLGSRLKDLEGTDASDLASNLRTLQAAAGFDRLEEMRNNSPTGGALGSITEQELALLKATWGSIEQSQSEAQFKENLAKFREQVEASWDRVNAAYQKDYGQPYFSEQGQAPAATAAPRRRYNPSTGMIE